jgi:hypothetical protein
MTLLARTFAGVLVTMAFVAPLVATAHCDGDHETAAECVNECACACFSALNFACREQAIGLVARMSDRVCFTELPSTGRLSVTDIFRPPIAA